MTKEEKSKKLLDLGIDIYDKSENLGAVMYLAYAIGLADANKKTA